MPQRTDTPWTNRYSLPAILENQPLVEGRERYSVRLPSGARYTLCRPQPAEDAASWNPRAHYASAMRGRKRSLNSEEGTLL